MKKKISRKTRNAGIVKLIVRPMIDQCKMKMEDKSYGKY
jgi:hypothetical protein